jgi:hypothetical protein
MRTLYSIAEVRSEKFEGRGVEFSSSLAPPSTPHPSPLLDRGGEGARAGAVLDHARRRALLLPANRQEKHFQRAAQAALCYLTPEL